MKSRDNVDKHMEIARIDKDVGDDLRTPLDFSNNLVCNLLNESLLNLFHYCLPFACHLHNAYHYSVVPCSFSLEPQFEKLIKLTVFF